LAEEEEEFFNALLISDETYKGEEISASLSVSEIAQNVRSVFTELDLFAITRIYRVSILDRCLSAFSAARNHENIKIEANDRIVQRLVPRVRLVAETLLKNSG